MITEARSTPRGRRLDVEVRPGTNDHNVAVSCLDEDEYALKDVQLGIGVAVDIGAHIGGVTLALALDNPHARVIAVEALAENVAVLQGNVERAGVADRVTIVHAAASRPAKRNCYVDWDFKGGEAGTHHRYIGNAHLPKEALVGAEKRKVRCIDLGALVVMAGGHVDFLKIDAEGAEYDVFVSGALREVREIRGEYHDGYSRLVGLLDATHLVRRLSGTEHFGAFEALRRDGL